MGVDDLHRNPDNRLATVAACAALGRESASATLPLAPRHWNALALWLHQHDLQPGALLNPHERVIERLTVDEPELAMMIDGLQNRATTAAFELERLEHRGIWALARFEEAYPARWRDLLKGSAPPVLFGAGPASLLNSRSIGIVGSREIDQNLMEIAETLGRSIAKTGAVMVSGGARGSDRMGMTGAIDYGGEVVGVLSGDLDRLSRQPELRRWIENETLCLVSHVHPGTGFSAGNAMARNKLIYTLAEATIVISTAEGTGGTWSGAVENLKRHWAPLLIWTGEGAPFANQALVRKGGFPFATVPADADEFEALVDAATDHWRTWSAPEEPDRPIQQAFEI